MEHWASAICLGLMKDVRAFPVLENLLLDGLDREEYTRIYREENEALILRSELVCCLSWVGDPVARGLGFSLSARNSEADLHGLRAHPTTSHSTTPASSLMVGRVQL